jgi:hypothetical protein
MAKAVRLAARRMRWTASVAICRPRLPDRTQHSINRHGDQKYREEPKTQIPVTYAQQNIHPRESLQTIDLSGVWTNGPEKALGGGFAPVKLMFRDATRTIEGRLVGAAVARLIPGQ